jgi:hypothetical protein
MKEIKVEIPEICITCDCIKANYSTYTHCIIPVCGYPYKPVILSDIKVCPANGRELE